ncbi:MAG: sulfurtransferase complex subunit TusB [Colwellia sp.]
MSTLHIVRQSAFSTDDFYQCIKTINNNDIIVFIDDGCYNLKHPLIKESTLLTHKIQLKIMSIHAQARAINVLEENINNTMNADEITMKDLVTLTFEKDNVITWQ